MLRVLRRLTSGLAVLLVGLLLFELPLAPAQAGFGEFTIRDELELARKFDLMIESRFFVIQDNEITGYIQGLVDRIVKVMPPQPFPIKVTVVRNGAMNAFASAAGHITVFTGLMTNLASEDELASVLAHELSHVSERHIAKSIEKNQLIGVGSLLGMLAGVLIGAKGNSESSEAAMIGTIAGAQATMLKYSRENEQEADQFGLSFLSDAGFAPSGMPKAFEKIKKLQWLAGGGDIPSYLSTHPGLDERVGYIQDRVNRLPESIRKRNSENSRFLRVQMLVQAWFSEPATALAVFTSSDKYPPCLAKLGKAIALSREHQIDAAKGAFAEAVPCPGGDGLWKREYGRFSFDYGKLDAAVSALQEAVLKNPDDLYALFFYARAVAEQGNFTSAVTAMQRVAKAVPHDFEVLENLARYYAATGNNFSAHLSFAKGFAYKRQFQKYLFHFEKAAGEAKTPEQRRQLEELRQEIHEYREILGLPGS